MNLSAESCHRWMIVLTVTTAVIGAVLAWIGPKNIIMLEMAGSAGDARHFITSHGCTDSQLKWQLGVDYLFLASYSPLLALSCFHAASLCASQGWGLVAGAGVVLAWLQWLAGGLDAVENTALLKFLATKESDLLISVSRGCATLKFALMIAGCLYAGSCLLLSPSSIHPASQRVFGILLLCVAVVFSLPVRAALVNSARGKPNSTLRE